jgi:hypothetical protein
MESKLGKLDIKDIVKGLVMAVLTPAVFVLQQSIEAGTFTFNWHQVALAAVAGGFGYLIKNFFTNSDGKPFSTEKK